MRNIPQFGNTPENAIININISVEIRTKDYDLLKKWGFDIEKNTSEMLKTYAEAIRRCSDQ